MVRQRLHRHILDQRRDEGDLSGDINYSLIFVMLTCGVLYVFAVLSAIYILHMIQEIIKHLRNPPSGRLTAADLHALDPSTLPSCYVVSQTWKLLKNVLGRIFRRQGNDNSA